MKSTKFYITPFSKLTTFLSGQWLPYHSWWLLQSIIHTHQRRLNVKDLATAGYKQMPSLDDTSASRRSNLYQYLAAHCGHPYIWLNALVGRIGVSRILHAQRLIQPINFEVPWIFVRSKKTVTHGWTWLIHNEEHFTNKLFHIDSVADKYIHGFEINELLRWNFVFLAWTYVPRCWFFELIHGQSQAPSAAARRHEVLLPSVVRSGRWLITGCDY